MSDVIINVELDEGVVLSTTPDDDVVVNIIEESPVVINMCGSSETTPTDYANLSGKPKINGVELIEDKSLSQLGIEPKKGGDDFYITNAEKNQGALTTGVTSPSPYSNADLSTLKKLADSYDKTSLRVLREIAVPANTGSVVINTTDSGISFSDLSITQLNIDISGLLLSDTVSNCFIGVNGLYSEPLANYYQLGAGTQPSGFLAIIRKYFSITGRITVVGSNLVALIGNWRSTALSPVSNVATVVQSGVKFGNISNTISEVKITVVGSSFDAGTVIKITKVC